MNPTAVTSYLSGIDALSRTDFKKWQEQIGIVLGCLDLVYALRESVPTKPKIESSNEEKALYEKQERLNRMSLMIIMKSSINPHIHGAIPDSDVASSYMKSVRRAVFGNFQIFGQLVPL